MKNKPAPVEDRMMRGKAEHRPRPCPACAGEGEQEVDDTDEEGKPLVTARICRRCNGTGVLAVLVALFMMVRLVTQAATVTGSVSTASSNPYATNVYFIPLSTPLVNGGQLIASVATNVACSAVGAFSVALQAGDYRVNIGQLQRDTFFISVPTNVATYNITTLITNVLTYIYRSNPSYLSAAEASALYAPIGSGGGGAFNPNQFSGGGTTNIKIGAVLTNSQIFSSGGSVTPLKVVGQQGQDADLQQWYVDAAVLVRIQYDGMIVAPNVPAMAGANLVIAENGANSARLGKSMTGAGGLTVHHTDGSIVVSNSSASSVPVALSYSGTNVLIDFSLGNWFTLTATAPFRFLSTNWLAGQTALITVTQDATGNRSAAWETNGFMFPGGFPIALTTNALAVDILSTSAAPISVPTNVLVTSSLNFRKQ